MEFALQLSWRTTRRMSNARNNAHNCHCLGKVVAGERVGAAVALATALDKNLTSTWTH